MRGRERLEIGQRLRPGRQVFKLAGGRKGRRVDQVHRERVRRLSASDGGRIFLHEVALRHFGQLDLVLVAGIECLDGFLETVANTRTDPHLDRVRPSGRRDQHCGKRCCGKQFFHDISSQKGLSSALKLPFTDRPARRDRSRAPPACRAACASPVRVSGPLPGPAP